MLPRRILNNITKYARATKVMINICLEKDQVFMEIQDNGIGFDQTNIKPTSLGMHIMQERADAIEASFGVESHPGQGTTVSLEWNADR